MSLIERAIDKLTTSPPSPAGDRPLPSGASPASTIEQAAMRLAAQVPRPRDDTPTSAVTSDAEVAVLEPPSRRTPAPASSSAASAPPRATPAPFDIDLASLRARGFVTPDGGNSGSSQEFRVIKRPLLSHAFGPRAADFPNGRRVLVTSALPGEGKSHCAINLAMSIAAERDHQVLLVDADVARPSVPRQLGIQTDVGLMDWLIDGKPDLSELIRPTNVDKLSILPAGRRHAHATELLASDAMTLLLEELTARFPDHLFVFDSPPLMVTTESRVLASYMGQVVMVVESGRTQRDVVDEALGMLSKDQFVGLVLNKSREAGAGGYYGYQGQTYGSDRD
jgi:protein-tyrosine kinase